MRIVVGLLLIAGCTPLISPFDQYSYTQTTSLKVEALSVMGEATEDYSLHESEAKAVMLSINKMVEYELHRPKNTQTTEQWQTLSDTSGNSFGGFIKEWKAKRILKVKYIPIKQQQVREGFDKIIALEAAKIRL